MVPVQRSARASFASAIAVALVVCAMVGVVLLVPDVETPNGHGVARLLLPSQVLDVLDHEGGWEGGGCVMHPHSGVVVVVVVCVGMLLRGSSLAGPACVAMPGELACHCYLTPAARIMCMFRRWRCAATLHRRRQ